MTALRKDVGGVRGIVVEDVVRRLLSRTMVRQLGEAVKVAIAPFQYALSTRVGCECVAHVLQAVTEADPSATVLSIDGSALLIPYPGKLSSRDSATLKEGSRRCLSSGCSTVSRRSACGRERWHGARHPRR